MKVYRQGDIILREIKETPKYKKKISNNLEIKGETGQAHIIETPVYRTLQIRGVRQPLFSFIDVEQNGAIMKHPEHPELKIDEGVYTIDRVRTYTPRGIRAVLD